MRTAESARVACDPSSYKAFDKAAIGISIEQVERGSRQGGGVELEIGFEPSRGRRANRDPQEMRGVEKKEDFDGVCARFGSCVRLYARFCVDVLVLRG